MNIRSRPAVYAGVPFMTALAGCLFTAAAVQATPASPKPSESLVVLTDSGERRDDLPVVARHPAPDPYIYELTRGFSGRLLRLYPMVQRFAHPDRPPQPGYLVLTNNQGGFPRFGFHLDGRSMKEAAYVDLHRNSDLTNRFGAINQIYPHELLHIIVSDLAGPYPEGRDNQVHAVGVRTDRATAFSEGFAEHAQLMAVEAADVAAETKRLPADREQLARALQWFVAYRDAMSARWSIAPKARMTFPLGFSRNEQVLRYHGVRQNLFAHEPQEPSRQDRDLYGAYLIENTMPGPVDGPAKSAARLLATEGVVSTLFYRLATSAALRQTYRDGRFYASFGATREAVDPVDNVYLKLFAAIRTGGYDTVRIIDAYTTLFPEDAASVREIVRSTLLGQDLPRGASIWLLNDGLQTGTSLFDQYRGLPRAHTFDLNAASALDLLSVRGVTPDVATAILHDAPYERVADLKRVPSAASFVGQFARMEAAYRAHAGAPDDDRLSLEAVLYPYLWRALYVALACTIISAALYRAVRRARWWRLAFNGLGVALVGLIAGWTIDPGSGLLAMAAPIGIWGLPAAVIALRRTRSLRAAGMVLAAWTLASAVPAVIVRPMM